jgi:hypothetical protein
MILFNIYVWLYPKYPTNESEKPEHGHRKNFNAHMHNLGYDAD